MNNKFRYLIIPDRLYTFVYEDMESEVLGQDILDMFHRSIYLDKVLSELSTDNHISDDPDTLDL